MSVYLDRVNELRKIIDNDKKALLITNDNNIYYFSGFIKSEGAFLVTVDDAYLLVDFRYYEAACKTAKDCKVVMFSNMTKKAIEILNKTSVKELCVEIENTTLSMYDNYCSAFGNAGISLISDGALDKKISNQRLIKSAEEIECIEKAQYIAEKAYNQVLNFIKPGNTEHDIQIELEYLMKKYGAEDVSFDLITITGKKTSLPHGVPGNDIIKSGDFFTMDIGSLYRGYHSDMTRTVAVDSCSDEQREIYNIVLKAQLTALSMVKSGIVASEVDKAARDIIDNAGYGKCFGHSTGHGVGLDIHEKPYISPKGDTILSNGMIITVEPGIYIENKFGVRIEDMVLVKDQGYKNFATLSKELIIV